VTDIKAALHDTSRAAFFVHIHNWRGWTEWTYWTGWTEQTGRMGMGSNVYKLFALNYVKPYRVFIFINYICNQNFTLTLTI
jgi:hypothetical protein